MGRIPPSPGPTSPRVPVRLRTSADVVGWVFNAILVAIGVAVAAVALSA